MIAISRQVVPSMTTSYVIGKLVVMTTTAFHRMAKQLHLHHFVNPNTVACVMELFEKGSNTNRTGLVAFRLPELHLQQFLVL